MKEYIKPIIEEELIEIEDVVATSLTDAGDGGDVNDTEGGEEF